MIGLIRDAREVLENEGLRELTIRTVAYLYHEALRPHLPTVGYIERGMPIERGPILVGKEEKLLDRFVPFLYPGFRPHARIELGLRLGHLALTQPGDRVVVIGGGNGISATTAAHQVGEDGSVIVYDGMTGEDNDLFGVRHVEHTLSLNGVADWCEARHGLVGTKEDTIEGYSSHMNYDVPQILPSELPDCDVLEFDCNGMELDILRHMDIRPRALIVELEAPSYPEMWDGEAHPRDVLETLDDIGYTVIQRHGHEGRAIGAEQLLELIDLEYETGDNHQLPNGAKDSPILLAVRDDHLA